MKSVYCENCKQEVKPNDAFNLLLFVILLCCFFPAGIVYLIYASLQKRCPICKLKI